MNDRPTTRVLPYSDVDEDAAAGYNLNRAAALVALLDLVNQIALFRATKGQSNDPLRNDRAMRVRAPRSYVRQMASATLLRL